MNIKNGKVFISFLLALCITCLCSCDKAFKTNRIAEIYFVSCTDDYNTIYLNEENLASNWKKLLKQEEALELAHEVEKIPDSVSSEGECSYIIRIKYFEDGIEKSVEKNGYDTFPDNWDKVIELTNIVLGDYHQVTNSKELAVIDAEYLKEHDLMPDESILPEGMTMDEAIKGANITYLTIYEPKDYAYLYAKRIVGEAIKDYIFDYYGLNNHQIDGLDDNPPKSSRDEMMEFAESRLDEVNLNYCTGYNCWGTYNGETYKIIRYDMVQSWLADEEEYSHQSCFTSSYHQYQVTIQWEFSAFSTTTWNVFVDGSGKFLILTESENPTYIFAVVK